MPAKYESRDPDGVAQTSSLTARPLQNIRWAPAFAGVTRLEFVKQADFESTNPAPYSSGTTLKMPSKSLLAT